MNVIGCVWMDVRVCNVPGNTSCFGSICAGVQACVCDPKNLLPVLMQVGQVLLFSTFLSESLFGDGDCAVGVFVH